MKKIVTAHIAHFGDFMWEKKIGIFRFEKSEYLASLSPYLGLASVPGLSFRRSCPGLELALVPTGLSSGATSAPAPQTRTRAIPWEVLNLLLKGVQTRKDPSGPQA